MNSSRECPLKKKAYYEIIMLLDGFEKMKQEHREIMKKIGIGIIIIVVSVLTFKFIMWNKWKVERAAVLTEKILRAPAAVNLTLVHNNGILYQKSFANNPDGNYYIVNHFDITPHIDKADRLTLTVIVNGQKAVPVGLHRFKTFNIIRCTGFDPDTDTGIYFAFTTGDCGMEEFLRLIQSLPAIIDSLKTQK
jgi:hypothetical protein